LASALAALLLSASDGEDDDVEDIENRTMLRLVGDYLEPKATWDDICWFVLSTRRLLAVKYASEGSA
jgi:hypothetical protein